MAKMSPGELQSLVIARRDATTNKLDSEYSRNRREALAFYRGDNHTAYGPQEPGMSKVISRDTMEAVESMLPGLMRPFVSGDEVVRFEPVGPEDDESSKQASEYINYLFTRRNDGYGIIHTALKDGLLFRLGVGKVVREEVESYKAENYSGLTQLEVDAIKLDKDVEIVSETPNEESLGILFDVAAQRKTNKAKVTVYCVPPDEFLFERHLANLDDATFVGQESRRSVADLIAMGLPKAKCRELEADEPTVEGDERFKEESNISNTADSDISRMVRVTECYVKCDYEGNGKPSWRKVFVGGNGDDILLNEAVDCHPYVAWTPIPIPHKLVGLSIHDLTRDIQINKTALSREVMNNLYLTNRPMREVLDGQANVDDILNPRVGGVVRVKQMNATREINTPFTAANSMGIIEYYDTVREQRTGSTRYNQGMDANSLNKTATGIQNIMAAAGQRSEMFARQFAEQFLKPLFLKMLEIVCKHPDQKEVIRLRNQWVEMDPREWSTEYDMAVTVGLGTGSRDKQVVELQQLLQIDEQILQLQGGANGPLVTYQEIYGKLKRLVEAMGLKGIENYYKDPEEGDQQPQQQGPDPELAKIEADNQVKLQIARIDSDTKIEVAKINGEVELLKAQITAPPMIDSSNIGAEPEMQGDGPGMDETPMHEQPEMPQFEQQDPMMEPQEMGGEYGA
mgnify:CR=1 FL=1